MQYNTAHAAYSQNAVGGIESPTKLIEMLYEGVLRFVFRARKRCKIMMWRKKYIL